MKVSLVSHIDQIQQTEDFALIMIEIGIYVEMLLVILINGNHYGRMENVFFPKSIQTSFKESKKTFLISRIMNIPVY